MILYFVGHGMCVTCICTYIHTGRTSINKQILRFKLKSILVTMEMMTETLHIGYSVGEKVEELGSSHTIGGNVKYNDHLEKRVQQFQDKSNICIYHWTSSLF